MTAVQDKIRQCLELIKENSILVLATEGTRGPHTSLMTYVCSEDGLEVYMLSSTDSHKWQNILKNPRVSMMIDDRDGKLADQRQTIKALSITGEHRPVADNDQRRIIEKLIAESNPAIADAFSGPGCEIIHIRAESFLLLDGPQDSFYTEDI